MLVSVIYSPVRLLFLLFSVEYSAATPYVNRNFVLTSLLLSPNRYVCIASKATTSALNAGKSPAIPFLPEAENLKGYVGDDIGFDPLRISDYFPMDYLREAELK